MSGSEICLRDGVEVMLIHPAYKDRVEARWFHPGFWGARARPVDSGGRGSAWFISDDDVSAVLREYRRGGLIARLSEKNYVFTTESRVRSFAEFRLLNRMVGMGLPVPRPVAAMYRKINPLRYEAAIIVERLENTKPLADLVSSLDDEDWYRVGRTVRQFHDAGIQHADLNCFNILLRGGEAFLIDFDRGRLVGDSAPGAGWKKTNLDRLHRSLSKVSGDADGDSLRRSWQAFMRGYQSPLSTPGAA
ncbi:3-deoxy-D-manno-octulosonic-acid kinase [Marinobacter santoriniensis NKSG1]|uniref:3-deoxy-D-manno-octulosonic acid kinase n=1 Tax=Marinobacter santoriniensis NKSG1 TaxID=1288826 RepID=M7CLC2_9GAMM|nr:3-deoxy-D-manno-octulosonic acid kinase [Marinobacter santoriniensis]EMP54014.1 3-deoxy-D-manno-octulosonic-acid kinase [Marinobacter santoriniensis NKSG1]